MHFKPFVLNAIDEFANKTSRKGIMMELYNLLWWSEFVSIVHLYIASRWKGQTMINRTHFNIFLLSIHQFTDQISQFHYSPITNSFCSAITATLLICILWATHINLKLPLGRLTWS